MRRHWVAAARPGTLPAAVVPVLVGSGLAAGDGAFRWDAAAAALVAALAIQVAANFANDVSDARRGADSPDRLGPPRAVAGGVISAEAMWIATAIAVAVGAAAGAVLYVIAGPLVIVIGVASTLAMLGYVGGPIPYGYRGLGEVFVFVFFGVIATVGTRFVHDGTAPMGAWLLAIPVGLPVTAILVANNLRDIDTDAAAGKRTLAVILGRDRTRILFATLLWGAFAALFLLVVTGLVPLASGIALFWAPWAAPLIRSASSTTEGPKLISVLKGTSRLHLLMGLSMAVGAALG